MKISVALFHVATVGSLVGAILDNRSYPSPEGSAIMSKNQQGLNKSMDGSKEMPMDPEQLNSHMDSQHEEDSDIDWSKVTPIAHAMKHKHGQPIFEKPDLTPGEKLYWKQYNTTTFFTTSLGNSGALHFHMTTMILILVVVFPISLVLHSVSSRWYLPVLTINLLMTISSLIALSVFATTFPDNKSSDEYLSYPHNIYGVTSWILLFLTITHFVFALIYYASKSAQKYNLGNDTSNPYEIPMNNMENEINNDKVDEHLTDGRSAVYPSTSSVTPFNNSMKSPAPNQNSDINSLDRTSFDLDLEMEHDELHTDNDNNTAINTDINSSHNQSIDEDNMNTSNANSTEPLQTDLPVLRDLAPSHFEQFSIWERWLSNPRFQSVCDVLSPFSSNILTMLNYIMILYLFADIGVGYATGNLMGKGDRKFNLMAHWIKGAVFFFLGILSLARYCGLGAKYGWAWNSILFYNNDTQAKKNSFIIRHAPLGTVTMEGLESFLIFFYGITNIFLEHLASRDGIWTAKDLQHISIAFMYIGTGLCGLLTEIRLNSWKYNEVINQLSSSNSLSHTNSAYAAAPGYSMNPFPAFTIFWTGILMSQHAQASALSTKVHMQWGYLLSYGSFFRMFTFLVLYFRPNKNTLPSRPLTELITSFCLVAGGFIFMESTDQVIEAMEYRGFTPMFTFNVSVGFVSLLVAWEMLLFLWRDYLGRK